MGDVFSGTNSHMYETYGVYYGNPVYFLYDEDKEDRYGKYKAYTFSYNSHFFLVEMSDVLDNGKGKFRARPTSNNEDLSIEITGIGTLKDALVNVINCLYFKGERI